MMILKKAKLGPSDLKNSKVYINFSNNNSTWALSQHTLTVAHQACKLFKISLELVR